MSREEVVITIVPGNGLRERKAMTGAVELGRLDEVSSHQIGR